MPSRDQNRRSISLRGITYARLTEHCAELGVSISSFVERLVEEKMETAGEPIPEYVERKTPRPKPSAIDPTDEAKKHFTF